jgi:polyhydroxyalkanoate synthesis regulator phasin
MRYDKERSMDMKANADVNQEDTKKDKDKRDSPSLTYLVRRMMLAGVGAIALKHDELEEFVDKLVERGEIAKKDGEGLLSEMKERRSKYLHKEGSNPHKKVSEFFDRFGVPTKNDLDDLSDKISALEKKIDKLTKSKE